MRNNMVIIIIIIFVVIIFLLQSEFRTKWFYAYLLKSAILLTLSHHLPAALWFTRFML